MSVQSAGLLMFRFRGENLQVLLAHPGGLYWAKKDLASWSIPKGLFDKDEDALDAAKREFNEETGFKSTGVFIELTPLKQPSGKIIHCWAFEGDCDPSALKSNTFSMEWPPHSGVQSEFPEVDRAEWFDIKTAKQKILPGQAPFIDQLFQKLRQRPQ